MASMDFLRVMKLMPPSPEPWRTYTNLLSTPALAHHGGNIGSRAREPAPLRQGTIHANDVRGPWLRGGDSRIDDSGAGGGQERRRPLQGNLYARMDVARGAIRRRGRRGQPQARRRSSSETRSRDAAGAARLLDQCPSRGRGDTGIAALAGGANRLRSLQAPDRGADRGT